MRESIVMPETVASVLCKFMERDYICSRSDYGGGIPPIFLPELFLCFLK